MKNIKILIMFFAIISVVGVVGATYAYFNSLTTLINEFVSGTYAVSVQNSL